MSERTLYLYDAQNAIWSSRSHNKSGALLTVSLYRFTRASGCTHGIGSCYLNEKNIGRKFELSILDPFEIGEVEFLGFVTIEENKCIPDFMYKKMKEEEFFIRKEGLLQEFVAFKQSEEYIVVNASFCDVVPLF